MDIRNATFTADGRIDCDLDHPTFGWIPFTASETDVEEIGRAVFAMAVAKAPFPYNAPVVDDAADAAERRAQMKASRLQFLAALHNAGLLTAAEVTIARADALTQMVWKEAADFRRNSPVIASLGLTAAALDDLFRAAAVLEF